MRVHQAPVILGLSPGLGIPFKIVISDSEYYGSKMSDGNWSYIIEMLLRGDADMSVNGLTSNKERRDVVNFSFPLYVSDVSFVRTNLNLKQKNLLYWKLSLLKC